MFHPSITSDPAATAAARDALLSRGYTRLRQLVTTDGVRTLEAEIEAIAGGREVADPPMVLRDAAGAVILMNKIDRTSDLLYDLARAPELLGLASELLGKPALSLHVEYFAKPPHGGTVSRPHQDHAFYHAHFADELALAIWVALDDVGPDSGALEYAVNSPLALLPHAVSSSPDLDMEVVTTAGLTFEVAPVPRGGALVHHSYTVHRAATNATARPRRAVVFNYRGSPYREWLRDEVEA